MKVKIAGFKILPLRDYSSTHIFDHQPTTKDFVQVTDWVEVDLPDFKQSTIERAAEEQTDAKIAELSEAIDKLRAAKAEKVAA